MADTKRRHRVLVVEDEDNIALALDFLMTREGYDHSRVADGAEGWSVGKWQRATLGLVAEINGRGRPAILVGGTGLYFSALTEGLADIPAVPPEVRAEADARVEIHVMRGIGYLLKDVA